MQDIVQTFPMVLAAFCSFFFKLFHRNVWLVCERESDARDNGYWFFKYLCEIHQEVEAVYAIDRESPDYMKVASLGKTVQFGSFKHWLYYWTAKRNISSQKEGKPNAALCFILEVYLGFRKNRAYIRHGIVKDAQRWVYYDVTKINLFVCSSKREYDFVLKNFGYPKGNVKLLGLCRFDNLLSEHIVKKQILVMPTMREWLRNISSETFEYEGSYDIQDSEYIKTWNHFLNSESLYDILQKYQMKLIFYPHASMQKYVDLIENTNDAIILGRADEYDVQQLLMNSAMLITDYSSIYFDFAYMLKPVIYYQFDYEKYRRGQYQEGYFSYSADGFGPVVSDEEDLLKAIDDVCSKNLVMETVFQERAKNFFAFHDADNCKRTFETIQQM